MLKTVLFFRKPVPGYHSIEQLFDTIIKHLPVDIHSFRHTVKRVSCGFINRILNIFEASKNQQQVNHITGDIHYIALFLKKSKTILTIHDLEIIKRNHGIKRAILVLLWFYIPSKRVKYITVISEFTKNELLKYIHVPPGKIKVIPDCLPGVIEYVPKVFNTSCPHILHLGTKDNKNLPRLLEAIKNVSCRLTIVGELTPVQKELLGKLHINYQNYFGIPYDNVKQLYAEADILAFVSTYEGFGLPIIEAQATGRVVVTSNCSSMPEVAGGAAMLVDPTDIDSIRQGILSVIRNQELRESLIVKGLENVKRFLPGNVAEQYASLYWEIANN